jgi:hypothetical protein
MVKALRTKAIENVLRLHYLEVYVSRYFMNIIA